jgi:hypothetical protein
MSCKLNIDTPQGDFGTMQHLHFFLPNVLRRYWEFGRKVMKKHNWEALVIVVNAHFPIDV